MSEINPIFYKETFKKTTEDRQNKVLEVAVEEFAEKGYHNSSVNHIAKEAGISVGALYKYFNNKEDLYLAVVAHESLTLDKIMSEIDQEADFYDQIRNMFVLSATYGSKYARLSQINLELATRPMAGLAKRVSGIMEGSVSEYLIGLIQAQIDQGQISREVDPKVTAFCIDNLLIMFQLAHSSSYFKQRLQVYLGSETYDEDHVIDQMISFIKNQL